MKAVQLLVLVSLMWICAPSRVAAAETIFPDAVVPAARYNDAPNWELGTVFRATAPGKITHARVFSLGEESGDHQVRIWRNSDNTLVAGPIPWTFGGDEAWINLDLPDVSIEANTDYTISVSVPADGWYPANSQYFGVTGDNGGHLAYPQAAGVFSDAPGNRPTQAFGNSAYLRDVVFEAASLLPAIRVSGNGVLIPSGATAPNLADGTQFGGAKVGADPQSRTFTISNPGSASLELTGMPLVVIDGAQAADFTLTVPPASPVPVGGSTTFTVRFAPTVSGLRDARVVLTNNAGAPYQFAIEGIGMGNDYRTLGNKTGTRVLTIVSDQLVGSRFMAMRNMQLSQLHVQVARLVSSAGDARLKGAIYEDSPGGPKFLGGTSELVNPTNGWHTLPLTQPVNVAVASNYWLVIWASGEQIQIYGDSAGRFQWGSYAYGNVWPDPADLSTGSSAASFCLYAEGLPTDVSGPEMEVQGKGFYVLPGATQGTSVNGTDLGSVMLYGGTREVTFTVLNVGSGNLSLNGTPVVTITGPAAGDFTVVTPPAVSVPSGGSSPLTLRFAPSAAGLRTATVVIPHADSPTAYQFAVQGVGLNPPGAAVLGLDGIGVDSRPNDAYNIIGNRFLAPGNLRITELHAKVVALAGSFTCAVYSDNNGLADRLLGNTAPVVNPTNGWNTFTLSSPLDIAGGNFYWLLIWSDTPSAALQNDPVGTAYVGSYPYADLGGVWPDPINLATPITWEARTVCIYAEGTPLAPAPGAQVNLRGNGKLIVFGDTSPSTLDGTDFGSLAVGTGTLDHTFTIENSGAAPLQLTGAPPVSITGPQSGDFQVTAPPTSPVAPGGRATFTVRFAPSAVGLRSATIRLANNDLDPDKNPYEFAVRGAGLFVGRESIFPDSKVGADVDNDGTAYALGTIFRSSVPGTVTQLRVFSVAGDHGAHRAWIWRTSDQTPVGGPYVWDFGGVTGWVYFDISPVNIDALTDYTVSISTGTGRMRDYANIAADVGDGGNNGLHLSYPPDAGVFLENDLNAMPVKTWNSSTYLRDIMFVPATNTIPFPVMTVIGNSNPIPDGYSSPSTNNHTDFGRATVGGATADRTFVIANTGAAPLTLGGTPKVFLSGPHAGDFQVLTPPTSPIPPGGNSPFTIRFAPLAAGLRSAIVAVENNDKNPFYFSLAGTGEAPLVVRITRLTADLATGDMTLLWEGPGQQYQVERAPSLGGTFLPIGTPQVAPSYTDPGILRTTNASAFYRIRY